MSDEEKKYEIQATVKIKTTYTADNHRECKRNLEVDLIRQGYKDVDIHFISTKVVSDE